MIPHSGILRYKDNEVHCLRMGTGPRLLIAFHGFGNTANLFYPLAEKLQQEYTTVAIDLPGHGKTKWTQAYFEKKDLMAVVQGVCKDFGAEDFALTGFSLGGRVCLSILEQQPNWVNKLVLIAPDGLEKNFWYNLCTRNFVGKAMFKRLMKDPQLWLKRLSFLQHRRWVSPSRFKFAENYLADAATRHRLSYVWPLTSKLVPHSGRVKWLLNKFKIETTIFMGKHDHIFPPEQGKRFVRNLKTARLSVLETGHNLMGSNIFLPEIVKAFY